MYELALLLLLHSSFMFIFDIVFARLPDSSEGRSLYAQWLAPTTEFEEQIQDFCL